MGVICSHFANTSSRLDRLILVSMAIATENLHGFLNPNDPVAISFWIISISMVAATVFFLMESMNVSYHWKTSMNVGALVTLVAGVHYFYMREFWVTIHMSPILYRYIDWSITVPLQMIEFYWILSAVQPTLGVGMFWRLMLGTVAKDGQQVNKYVQQSFGTMRLIVTAGWSIYPLGYFFGYLMGAVDDHVLNLVYNLADFVNKIAFCLAIWQAAKNSTLDKAAALLPA